MSVVDPVPSELTRDYLLISTGEFDSSTHYWLVLNELGVVVELPAGVVLLFPSALIQHGLSLIHI